MKTKPELACAYVLGELDDAEQRAVEQQAAVDPELHALIDDYGAGAQAALTDLPARKPSSAVLAQIERRLDRPTASAPISHPTRLHWAALGAMAALVVAGIGLGTFAWLHHGQRPVVVLAELSADRTDLKQLRMEPGSQTAAAADRTDARFIGLASLAERLWDTSRHSPAQTGGYAVFDPSTQQGFVAVRHVTPTRSGKRYHLWVVDGKSGALRDAGELPLEAANHGLFFFSLPEAPPERGTMPGFFITLEDGATPRAPAGPVVLGHRPF